MSAPRRLALREPSGSRRAPAGAQVASRNGRRAPRRASRERRPVSAGPARTARGRARSGERPRGDPRRRRDHVVARLCVRIAHRRIDDEHDRRAIRRIRHADVVRRSVVARARLVGDAPVGRHARADARVARLVAEHPCIELRALRGAERVAHEQPVHARGHRGGRRRIALVAGQRRVQLRLAAIEPERRVADRARIRGDGLRPAEQRHQQVRRGVVAVLERRRAQLGHAHAGAHVLLGDRRIADEIALRVRNPPLQQRGLAGAAREDRSAKHHLGCAAERETLVAAMRDARAGRGVERDEAQAAVERRFEFAQLPLGGGDVFRLAAQRRAGADQWGGNGCDEQRAAQRRMIHQADRGKIERARIGHAACAHPTSRPASVSALVTGVRANLWRPAQACRTAAGRSRAAGTPLALLPARQIRHRIDGLAVAPHLEQHSGAYAVAGAHLGDLFALLNDVARLHEHLAVVRVSGQKIRVVLDQDQRAVPVQARARVHHPAGRRGTHRIARAPDDPDAAIAAGLERFDDRALRRPRERDRLRVPLRFLDDPMVRHPVRGAFGRRCRLRRIGDRRPARAARRIGRARGAGCIAGRAGRARAIRRLGGDRVFRTRRRDPQYLADADPGAPAHPVPGLQLAHGAAVRLRDRRQRIAAPHDVACRDRRRRGGVLRMLRRVARRRGRGLRGARRRRGGRERISRRDGRRGCAARDDERGRHAGQPCDTAVDLALAHARDNSSHRIFRASQNSSGARVTGCKNDDKIAAGIARGEIESIEPDGKRNNQPATRDARGLDARHKIRVRAANPIEPSPFSANDRAFDPSRPARNTTAGPRRASNPRGRCSMPRASRLRVRSASNTRKRCRNRERRYAPRS
ncbi:hypothetical protein BURPS1710b_A2552 [Burkholderia pseudomallei 1710b]|uniref:Uncharacterized protein n=1 Tax=Burkholderia pseudomallei (strain 1710b) TaxID=320372 RepID=Q3JFF3_BURP1|nr:hypothetical protein BURPS1710b_A2552 [Burkholderia pseudomallei 1710b]